MSKTINYILIVVGGGITFYAQAEEQQNEYILIGGVAMLMLGIYRLARTIPSKVEKEEGTDDNDILNH